MSGGSYDYLYSKIECMADEIPLHSPCDDYVQPSLRAAFKKHLYLVAAACRSIEWNDSCDGDYREIERIEACLPKDAEIQAAIECAMEVRDELSAIIDKAIKGEKK